VKSNESLKDEFIKLNFFKKVWYSISKYEKYPELAALGVKKAIIYFTEIILIASIIYTAIYIYYIQNRANYDKEDLSFSQKIVKNLVPNQLAENNEEFEEVYSILNSYSDSKIITITGISIFMAFFIATMFDVLILSLFGLINCFFAKIKINYKAIFNMSIYALTLSIILREIYYAITLLTDFKIKYFDIMYVTISYIILTAAIFLIKSNVIKQHLELMRIMEEGQEKYEETITITREPKDEKEEKKNDSKDKDETDVDEQGSNA